MDVVNLFVSIIGIIVTVLSSIFALKQATQAKNSATEAELIKNKIEREQKKIEIGKLLNTIKTEIKNSVLLTTPANPEKKIRGLNYENTISSLRTFIDYLKENCHYLPNDKEQLVIIEYKKIESLILGLAKEKEQEKKYSIGDNIHYSIGELLRLVKPETDIE